MINNIKQCMFNKKQKMSSSSSDITFNEEDIIESKNLLLDVPDEIVEIYSSFLDLKSNAMFNCACKKGCDKKSLRRSELFALSKMFVSIVDMVTNIHDIFGTLDGQKKLLSNMLRRLIYTSVSDIPTDADQSYASSKTLTEYKRIMEIVVEEMDISLFNFNNLLEDSQFEYRGYEIINIVKEKREELDNFKNIISNRYFSNEFTIHTYSTFGNMFLELQCDDDHVMIDIHEKKDINAFNWTFLTDVIKQFVFYNPEHKLIYEMKNSTIEINDNMIYWNKDNQNAPYVIVELIHELLDCSSIYKGSDDTIVEVWNDSVEINWLLGDVVNEVQNSGMYSNMLRDITNDIQDEYNACML